MLKRLQQNDVLFDESGAVVSVKDASFPAPFRSGLEYGSPARGTWNIVHTGMLIPGAHQIFVCAAGCLRGVVLTAAEMGAAERFSTVEIRENNVLDGDMEELIIDGVSDIIGKLPSAPPAILIYTSCIHHFMSVDLDRVYEVLRGKFPNIDFTDCYMNPIMRKSGLTPDELMRRQLYSLLKPAEKDAKAINILGNDLATDDSSELVRMIKDNGFTLRDITYCKTYDEYQKMAEASLNITTYPSAKAGGDEISEKIDAKHLYLPQSFDYDEIERLLGILSDELNVKKPDYSSEKEKAEAALSKAKSIISDTIIDIDYTAVPQPLGLARLLLSHGFNVETVYLDSITGDDKSAFEWLQKNAPDLTLSATVHPKMRVMPRNSDEKILAIGQKAAYFTGTSHFVNIIEGGGLYGFDGIVKLCDLMTEAFNTEKNTRSLISIKGFGCGEGCAL